MLKLLYLSLPFLLISCNGSGKKVITQNKQATKTAIKIPSFNKDSAYRYVAKQVDFGPRVPNTPEHLACAEYLAGKLKQFGANVITQEAKVRAFDNTWLHAKNIIAQFQPEKNNRLLLFAHWDTRPFADHDPDEAQRNKPIDGANDGASGVGVLLEIARQLSKQPTNMGIDIIFFDAEDYGTPDHIPTTYQPDTWCLGSQYWGKRPHKANYQARYGILLDMVGAPNATFYLEGHSMQFAAQVTNNIWHQAHQLGFGNQFIFEPGGMITDDHVYVNKYTGIPCVDIIQFDPTSNSSFGHYWHTHEDTMNNIDKETLHAVGQTVLQIIYSEE